MRIELDDADLQRLFSSAQSLPQDVLSEAQKRIDEDLELKYAFENDPYGRPWKQRKVQGDGHPLLDDTGDLKASRKVTINEDGSLNISYEDPKASFHQDGTDTMPARELLPDLDRGLPDSWNDILDAALADLVGRL